MFPSLAAKPIFAVWRVAPRPMAPAATLEIATPAMAVATGTGPMLRRPRLMPMADLMPPPTMVATTGPHTADTAPDAFLSVMETDRGGRPFGGSVLHRGAGFLAEPNLPGTA